MPEQRIRSEVDVWRGVFFVPHEGKLHHSTIPPLIPCSWVLTVGYALISYLAAESTGKGIYLCRPQNYSGSLYKFGCCAKPRTIISLPCPIPFLQTMQSNGLGR